VAYPLRRSGLAASIAAGAVLCALTAVITVSGTDSDLAWLEALARALTVAAPIGVGIYALYRPPFERFGALLTLTGFVWFLTTLANSDDAVIYSVGRVSAWVVELPLVILLLAFPTGRLEARTDRALVYAVAVLVLVFYLPTALVTERYPAPGPWMSCNADCPDNAFMLTASEPAIVEDVIRPVRETFVLLLYLAVAVRLAQRIVAARARLVRRTVMPVLAVAIVRCAVFGGLVTVRRIAPDSSEVEAWMWVIAAMVPLMCAAFLLGLARWWMFMARSTRKLAVRLRGHPGPPELRDALAEAFDDPSLEVVYRQEDGRWADATGTPRALPQPTRETCVTEVADDDRVLAAIIHDRALGDDPGFIDTASAYVVTQTRIRTAAGDERRRIERDLHDGAQQRLVALAINLGLAAERSGDDGEHAAAVMRRLALEVEHALDELRALTRGVPPAPLADGGLVEGLRAAALRSPIPATVLGAGVRRYPAEIENAAYFCCLEAMQNAAKHALGATAVVIDLSEAEELRLEVRDDGAGFDPARVAGGLGLISMRERLAAVGGELTVVSSPGHGTRIIGSIPLGTVARPSVMRLG
jgi:signal transduction histidine kinase